MDETKAKDLGATICQRRHALGFTVRQVESVTKIPNTTISRIEMGLFKAPRPDYLVRIANVLGLSAGDLFAMAGYLTAADLPEYETYLRTKHPDLPEVDLVSMANQFSELLKKLGHTFSPSTVIEEQSDEPPGASR